MYDFYGCFLFQTLINILRIYSYYLQKSKIHDDIQYSDQKNLGYGNHSPYALIPSYSKCSLLFFKL